MLSPALCATFSAMQTKDTPQTAPPHPREVETWLFDLDNTLYPASCRLFDQIDRRMGLFIEQRFGLSSEAARHMQKSFFHTHGTTLRGLMTEHAIDPGEYLDFVHDIDLSGLEADSRLDAALAALPGRKVIFTNADTGHAERVLERLALAHHFEAIFDIRAAEFVPKPDEGPYDRLLENHGLAAPRTVFFEDSARNLKPAHARGMTTVWVRHEANWSAPPDEDDYIHHRTDDLTAWLQALQDGRD